MRFWLVLSLFAMVVSSFHPDLFPGRFPCSENPKRGGWVEGGISRHVSCLPNTAEVLIEWIKPQDQEIFQNYIVLTKSTKRGLSGFTQTRILLGRKYIFVSSLSVSFFIISCLDFHCLHCLTHFFIFFLINASSLFLLLPILLPVCIIHY